VPGKAANCLCFFVLVFFFHIGLSILRFLEHQEKIDMAIARNSLLAQKVWTGPKHRLAKSSREGADVIEHAGRWGRGHLRESFRSKASPRTQTEKHQNGVAARIYIMRNPEFPAEQLAVKCRDRELNARLTRHGQWQ
jgi:hypothetical protein